MPGKKTKAAPPESPTAVTVPGRLEWPNLTVRDLELPEEQAEGVTGGVTVEVAMRPGPGPVPVPYPNQGLSGEPTRRKS
jgi:hypothetical protein